MNPSVPRCHASAEWGAVSGPWSVMSSAASAYGLRLPLTYGLQPTVSAYGLQPTASSLPSPQLATFSQS